MIIINLCDGYTIYNNITSVQFSHSVVSASVTPWTADCQASLSIANSWSLLKLMCIESVMPSNHLVLCCPILLLPSVFPSIRVFSNESALCIRWPKYWSFSISPSNEYSGLISFRIEWFDLLVVQGTLKNLLQHRSSKASILQHSPFFMVQLSHSFITIGKTIALTRWTFVSKVERSRCRYIGGWVSQVELVVKNLPAKAGDIREVGLIPGSGRSSGGGNCNPL